AGKEKNASESEGEAEAKQAEKNKQKRQIQALSFNLDENEDEIEISSDEDNAEKSPQSENVQFDGPAIKKIKKNPNVDTNFLLDWDGSGHRRSVIMKKGESCSCHFWSNIGVIYNSAAQIKFFHASNFIYQLLQRCLEVLRREFSELKTVMADQLMHEERASLCLHLTFTMIFVLCTMLLSKPRNHMPEKFYLDGNLLIQRKVTTSIQCRIKIGRKIKFDKLRFNELSNFV
ncbi:Uncharacterized protein DBV15_11903, partial [Temnothorax longispinosus]